MTQPRHPLTPSSSAHLAIAALATQGQYGAVTGLAREYGLRRQQVYDLREHGRVTLEAAFAPAESKVRGSFTLEVTPRDIERAIVAMRVIAPASVRDIRSLVTTLYGVSWSYGKVWSVLNTAEQQAAEHLRSVDLSNVDSVALDEMFSQGRPVLAGIDLDTQYLFQLEVQNSRSGETWARSLGTLRDQQGLSPARVVKDAGTGLGAGVRHCWPTADEHDDLFHATYIVGKVARRLEQGAYRAMETEEKLTAKRARGRTESDRRSLGQDLRRARGHMETAIERYDRFEAQYRQAVQILELTDRGSGRLRTSAEVVETLTQVADDMEAIGGKHVRRAARYLRNRAGGLGKYLDDLGSRLKEAAADLGDRNAVEAATRAYQASLQVHQGGPRWDRKARGQELKEAARHLVDATERSPERLKEVIGAVLPELARRHRASSAIENLNSVLRPYLVVQKHAEQGFLNLFRFFWNTRTREWGRWKGTSAHELLTGEKVDDWLTLLGFPPSSARAAAA